MLLHVHRSEPHSRHSTYIHEAAHAVVSIFLDCKSDCIRLGRKAHPLGAEIAAVATGPCKEPDNLELRAKIDAAGYAAQLHISDHPWEALDGASGDIASIETYLIECDRSRRFTRREMSLVAFGIQVNWCRQLFSSTPEVWLAIEAVAALIEDFDSRGEEFLRAPEIYEVVSRHLSIDPFVAEPPDGDPCAESPS